MPITPKKRSKKTGLPPATIVYTGERKAEPVKLSFARYSQDKYEESQDIGVSELEALTIGDGVLWVNVTGVHDAKILEAVGKKFGIHSLVLEDIANTSQRTKFEEYPEYAFVVLHSCSRMEGSTLKFEQASFIVGKSFVLSFNESRQQYIDDLRRQIRESRGIIRTQSSDYLAYALLDIIVDSLFVCLDELTEASYEIEKELLQEPGRHVLNSIYSLKWQVAAFRKAASPLRDVFIKFERGGHTCIRVETLPYFRDLHDHAILLGESIETCRESLTSMLEIYLSNINVKTNTVIQVLTVVATIFLPLTFITGIYGMNFKVIPELQWENGYYYSLALMVVVALFMLFYFKRKKFF